jgi:hypothetical protein
VSPRPSPIVNHVLKVIVIMFYRLVSQVLYKLVGLCVDRPRSLSVGGQEPANVFVCVYIYIYICRMINKI